MMKKILFLLLLVTSFVGFGQKKIDVGTFQSLRVFDKLNVRLIPAEENAIEINGELVDEVTYNNKDGELTLAMSAKYLLKGENTNVTVYYKDSLVKIVANGGSIINADGTLSGKQIEINCNQGSVVSLAVNVKDITTTVNSGGELNLKGVSQYQTVTCNTGGTYNGHHLEVENVIVSVKAGGKAIVYATQKCDAKTLAGGTIDIYGTADVKQKTTMGGAIIVH